MKYLIIISIIIYWTNIILLETATIDTTFVQHVASIYIVWRTISSTKTVSLLQLPHFIIIHSFYH